jgi:hypothetical protein
VPVPFADVRNWLARVPDDGARQRSGGAQARDTDVLDASHANTVSTGSFIEGSLKGMLVSESQTGRLSRRCRTQQRWGVRIKESWSQSWPYRWLVENAPPKMIRKGDSLGIRFSKSWLRALLQAACRISLSLTTSSPLLMNTLPQTTSSHPFFSLAIERRTIHSMGQESAPRRGAQRILGSHF